MWLLFLEFKMQEYIIWFLFFALGFSFSKAFGFLTAVGYSLNILKGSEIIALRMVSKVSDDVESLRDIKYHMLREAGESDRKIELSKTIDERRMQNWKDLVVKCILNNYPNSYKESVEYRDWAGAMRYLKLLSK
tara:strand:- start:2170 stop:2571 length:402 start_codon:yes stop_codon:yes gene_type:complete